MPTFTNGFFFALLTALFLLGPPPTEAQTIESSASVSAVSALLPVVIGTRLVL